MKSIKLYILLCMFLAASVFAFISCIFDAPQFSVTCREDGTLYYLNKQKLEQKHCSASEKVTFCSDELFAVYFVPDTIVYQTGMHTISQITGTIFPLQTELNTHGGFVSQVFIRLILQSNEKYAQAEEYVKKFNWKKLLEKIEEYENPYELEMDKIVTDIAEKKFSIYSIKKM